MHSTMQSPPLLLHRLLDRGPRLQPNNHVITKIDNGYNYVSYRDHMTQTYRLASALHSWGIKIGDVVGTYAYNSGRHMQMYHAIPCMGAVLHTLNIRLSTEELIYIINHGEDRVIIADAALLPQLEAIEPSKIPGIKLFIICGKNEKPGGWKSTLPNTIDYDDFLARYGADFYEWPDDLDENAPMGLCYTSGTTGRPKGVAYSHRSTYLHTMLLGLTNTFRISGTDTILSVVPMFHVMSWGLPFLALMLGNRIVQNSRFTSPADTLQMFVDQGVTFSAGVPTIWQGIRTALTSDEKLGKGLKLERLACGGSSPAVEMMKWYWDVHHVEFIQAWGMTETNPIGTVANQVWKYDHLSMSNEEKFKNVTNCGVVAPGLEIAILNSNNFDERLKEDGKNSGELAIRGPWVTGSYLKNPAKKSFHNGWLLTGDVATIDEEGYMKITDRSKDVIKSGGEWISSIDMENDIVALPGIAMACCVAMPHPKWDERPVVIVVASGEVPVPSLSEIRAELLKGQWAKFQLPDDILIWKEIPKTSTGKMSKKTARKMLKEQGYVLPSLRKKSKL